MCNVCIIACGSLHRSLPATNTLHLTSVVNGANTLSAITPSARAFDALLELTTGRPRRVCATRHESSAQQQHGANDAQTIPHHNHKLSSTHTSRRRPKRTASPSGIRCKLVHKDSIMEPMCGNLIGIVPSSIGRRKRLYVQ